MGSPTNSSENLQSTLSTSRTGVPCPLGALGPGSGQFRATCDVTNKINIDKYFELMKEEFTETSPTSKPLRSPRKTLGRSASSSTIEPVTFSNNPIPLSPRRKKNAKKRISCDENSLKMYAARNIMHKHTENFFNYDLTGQMMKSEEEQHKQNHVLSKQKSWDLSNSKRRTEDSTSDDDEEVFVDDLSLSYSVGDFRKYNADKNNNNTIPVVKASKSCESISSLGERHKEYAMMQGKIGSVSEENRRRRRKLYRRGKKGSDERPASMIDDFGRINHLLKEKLVIDVG